MRHITEVTPPTIICVLGSLNPPALPVEEGSDVVAEGVAGGVVADGDAEGVGDKAEEGGGEAAAAAFSFFSRLMMQFCACEKLTPSDCEVDTS